MSTIKPLLLALAFSGSLFATSLNVFSTGVDSLRVPLTLPNLPNGPRLLDTHWALISGPAIANSFVTDFMFPYLSEAPLNARWISPAITQAGLFVDREYTFGTFVLQQAFSLAGFLQSTATLSGVFAADNCAKLLLNTTVLARTGGSGNCPSSNPASNYTTLTNFSAGPSAFLPGQNILRIELYNEDISSGVLVDFTNASAEIATGVPEPSTYVLIGSALFILKMRRKKA